MHNKLQIIYKYNKPHGIRDENGYLFFFTDVSRFPGQEERYRQEVFEQYALADYLLSALKARSNTASTPTGGDSPASEISTTGEVTPSNQVVQIPPTSQ